MTPAAQIQTSAPPAFVGWTRRHRREPWRAVVEAETEAACWQLLLDLRLRGDKAVTVAGSVPWSRKEAKTC